MWAETYARAFHNTLIVKFLPIILFQLTQTSGPFFAVLLPRGAIKEVYLNKDIVAANKFHVSHLK